MQVRQTGIAGVVLIEPSVFEDERGFFMEAWHSAKYRALGIDVQFVQENHSRSRAGTLRGLHYQVERPQGKLVRVVQGSVFDVAVDLRRSSPTFGRWTGATLSGDNCHQLWIPTGCAHGFLVTSASADVVYLCSELYAPELERTLQWDDPELGISWPLTENRPILSPKDARGVPFAKSPLFP